MHRRSTVEGLPCLLVRHKQLVALAWVLPAVAGAWSGGGTSPEPGTERSNRCNEQ
jgi:hypothetical protein